MARISDRYKILKEIFDHFTQLAASQITNDKYPVKGVTVSPMLNENYFDVFFAGKRVRFSFSIVEDEKGYFQGLVRCNPVGYDGKPLDSIIGEFSFRRDAETNLKISEDDPVFLDSEKAAAYVILLLLSNIFNKIKMT